jgi:hypothetical protein
MANVDIYLYAGEVSVNDVKLRDPTVLAGGGGSQSITLPYLDDSVDTLYAPVLIQNIVLPLLTDSDTLYAPALSHVIALPFITDADSLYAPIISQVIALPYLDDSADTLYAPTVSQLLALILPFIDDSADTLYAPTLNPQPVTVVLPFIDSEEYAYELHSILREPLVYTGVGYK